MSASKLNSIIQNPTLRANLERRFWSKVDRRGPDDCWPWIAKAVISDLKYGAMTVGGTTVTGAHRVSFALANGGIGEGVHVRHKCDNPPCCNPRHLCGGTNRDNVRDMLERGRHAPGIRKGLVARKAKWESGLLRQTERQIQTTSEVMKRLWATPEWRKRTLERMPRGESHRCFGRSVTLSEETRAKIAASLTGKKHTPERRENQRRAALARSAKKRQAQ